MPSDPYSIFTEGLPAAPEVTPAPTDESSQPATAPDYSIFTEGLKPLVSDETEPSPEDVQKAARVNALRARSVDSLTNDETFDPVSAYSNPDFADPENKQKILDVFKARETAGFEPGKFAMGVLKAPGNVIKSIGTGLGTVAGQVTNIASGNKVRAESAAGELAAGAETNLASLAALLHRTAQFTGLREGGHPTDDAGWEKLLLDRQSLNQNIQHAASGQGDLSALVLDKENFGQDLKDVVEAHGGTIDAANAEAAAPVLDPTILVPLLAGMRSAGLAARAAEAGLSFEAGTDGIMLVSGAGKKLIVAPEGSALYKAFSAAATAGDIAVKITDAGSTLAKALGEKATSAAATGLEAAGNTAQFVADKTKQLKGLKGGLAGGVVESVLDHGAGVPFLGTAVGALAQPALRTAGEKLIETAGKLRGTVPAGPIWRQIADTASGDLAKGAAAGLAGDPLAATFTALNLAGSENSEQAGEALGSQAVFGAGGHALAATAPYFDIAGQILKPGEASAPIASAPYGTVPTLDAVSNTTLAKLPQPVQNAINQFREAVRGRNTQIYVVPPADFGRAYTSFKAQEATAKGTPLTNEQLTAYRDLSSRAAASKGVVYDNFDLGDGVKRKVVFLNSDGGALQHEGGHVLTSLLDSTQYDQLANLIRKNYSPEEKAQFKADYEKRLGQKISEPDLIDEIMAENVSAVLASQPIEQLGAPKSVARAIYQGIGSLMENLGLRENSKTTLGARPDIRVGKLAENLLRAQEAENRPQLGKVAKVDLTKVDLGPKVAPARPQKPGEPIIRPAAENIRVGRMDQNRFSRAATDEGNAKAAAAVDSNPNYGPVQKAAFVRLAAVLAQGGDRPRPVEVEYNAAKSDEFAANRTTRRAEQAKAADAEARGDLPESVRQQTQKVLIPERFEVRGNGEVQLVAKSLDKVISNAYRLARDAHANGVEHLVPYESKDGVLTENGWNQLVEDIQTYTRNQSNGYAGTGKAVTIPAGYKGEIPPQTPGFKPSALPQAKSDFVNMLMALPPPKTTAKKGVTRSGVPANVIARGLAEINQRPVLESVTSKPGKSHFEEHNVDIAELNPLRDAMAKAGVDVRNLNEVTERVNLSRINGEVKVRNDLDFSRPSTDLVRAGFMPDSPKAVRTGNPEVRDVADEYTKASGIPYRPYTGYAKIDPELGKSIADWYDSAKSDPSNPAIASAYDALIDQTKRQYDYMVHAGYKVEPWTQSGQPYESSADMVKDVRDNKHLWFFPTEGGFGTRESTESANPLLRPAGVEIDGKPLVANDLFRAVHDFFGHAKEGYEFGPRGEYNAFLAHSSMFTDEALPALASETLSQNAWVNFGPHLRRANGGIPVRGDEDFIPLQNRPFADQKVVAVPQELLDKALAPKTESTESAPTADFLPEAVKQDELRLIHLSGTTGLSKLSLKNFGKGFATPTDHRGLPKIFFFEEGSKPGADKFMTEGKQAYGATVPGNRIYDATKDALGWQDEINREKADEMLKDKGYEGLRIETQDGRKVVALFKDTAVEPLGAFKGGTKITSPSAKFAPEEVLTPEDVLRRGRDVSGWIFPDGKIIFGKRPFVHQELAETQGFKSIDAAKAEGGQRIVLGPSSSGEYAGQLILGVDTLAELPESQRRSVERMAKEHDLEVTLDTGKRARFLPGEVEPATPAVDPMEARGAKFWLSPQGALHPLGESRVHEGWARATLGLPNARVGDTVSHFDGTDGLFAKGWSRVIDTNNNRLLVSDEGGAPLTRLQKSTLQDLSISRRIDTVSHDNGDGTRNVFDREDSNPQAQFSPAPRTPAFERWFGDSKVVDKEGNPLLVYHGTGNDFHSFEIEGQYERAAYFTPNIKTAKAFAQEDSGEYPHVKRVYLSIQNPKIVKSPEITTEGATDPVKMEKIFSQARKEGHDGAILVGLKEFGGDSDQYVVFSSTQVKSENNRGTYDSKNPDIRFMPAPTPEEIRKLQDEYEALPESNGGRYLSTDTARPLVPGYSRTTIGESHQVAGRIVNELFDDRFHDPEIKNIIFAAGMPASGKTTGLKLYPEVDKNALVFDSTLGSARAPERVRQAVDTGKPVTVLYTWVDFPQAVQRMIQRAKTADRITPADNVAASYPQSMKNFLSLADEFKNNKNVTFSVVDNSGSRDSAHVVDNPEQFLEDKLNDTPDTATLTETAREAPGLDDIHPDLKSFFLGKESSGARGEGAQEQESQGRAASHAR